MSPTIAGHLKLTLRLLALKAIENGSDRLEEEEANYAVEYGGFDFLQGLLLLRDGVLQGFDSMKQASEHRCEVPKPQDPPTKMTRACSTLVDLWRSHMEIIKFCVISPRSTTKTGVSP